VSACGQPVGGGGGARRERSVWLGGLHDPRGGRGSVVSRPVYSDEKVANRVKGFGTGRQKLDRNGGQRLERWTTPTLSRRACSPRYTGYNPGEGNRRASQNSRVSDLPPGNPATLFRVPHLHGARAVGEQPRAHEALHAGGQPHELRRQQR
jgi:hypothetical protein